MLKVENISTGYGKKQVLFDVSFEVNKGDVVLLAGSNGSGKSTLLKAIFGLLPLWNSSPLDRGLVGKIVFEGENITGKSTSSLLKRGLLYIPQKNNHFDDLTVKENLQMAGLTLDKKVLNEQIEYVLSVFPTLQQFINRQPMKLSGGERQLLTLAMAMLHNPKMILLDEPFTGLSPKNMGFVVDNLRLLKEKNDIALVIVEHRVQECLRIANRVVGLKLGVVFRNSVSKNITDVSELNTIFV
jgi:branched-chain amino acid transport system ATP-binding protein